MGGSGSTRWVLHWKKTTVEECLKLKISDFRRGKDLSVNTSGVLSWSNGTRIGYSLQQSNDGLMLKLGYQVTIGGVQSTRNPAIRISSTDCNYGGVRYWFHCPRCYKRVSNLHLLGGHFACRKCHDLTYTSSQEAHQFDSLGAFGIDFKRLDELMDAQALLDKWDARKRLTKGERRKLADHMDLPLFMIRSRWYTLKTRARQELERRALVNDLLK
ncbi:MAG: hypothetical protein ABI970_22385 [Chloroflexota bacterium]